MRKLLMLWLGLALSTLILPTTVIAGHEDDEVDGAVYTSTNSPEGNEVLVFNRSESGALIAAGKYATGGLGTGAGLGNQGGVVLARGGRLLFVVNAGSDDISVFLVKKRRLKLINRVPSGGTTPVSIAVDRGLLYVLNAGSDNISGFKLSRRGHLTPLAGSVRPLSGTGTGPAQISFSPDGEALVVTEKATNLIDTYVVEDDGLVTGPFVQPSNGQTPFGFAFDRRGRLFVSEAAGGGEDASSVSSYKLADDGQLATISGAVGNTETAACWVVITGNGRYAYTTNTGSGTVSGYAINRRNGQLSLLNPDGVSGVTGDGSRPIDMALARGSKFLYTLNAGTATISTFRLRANGELIPLSTVTNLPTGLNGLAAQ